MTDNQQRAEALTMLARHDELRPAIRSIAAALDAAEARGRAELAAKVRELADELRGWRDLFEKSGLHVQAETIDGALMRLDRLADDTARTTDSRGPEPIADFPDGPDARDGTQ
jgi:DUF1680 family protein